MRNTENTLTQLRRLTIGLMVSGAANVALVFLCLYFAFKPAQIPIERPIGTVEIPAAYERTNGEVLRNFRVLPYEDLVQKLHDNTLIDNGYTVRDLALSALVNFHFVDLDRALGRTPADRSLVIGKRSNGSYLTVKVFPGLNDSAFEKIIFFMQTEKWPQNPNGLHQTLKKQTIPHDPTLVQAFSMTPHYGFIRKLMKGEGEPTTDELLQLIVESDWNHLDEWVQKKETGAAVRQQFLLRLISKKSRTAAKIFLKTDGVYAAFRLDDQHLITLLGLLEPGSAQADLLRKRVLASPRSDAVLAAAKKGGVPAKSEVPFKESVYIVQEGDNLWKISRKFHVDVDNIKRQNQLDSDKLKPGTSLKL